MRVTAAETVEPIPQAEGETVCMQEQKEQLRSANAQLLQILQDLDNRERALRISEEQFKKRCKAREEELEKKRVQADLFTAQLLRDAVRCPAMETTPTKWQAGTTAAPRQKILLADCEVAQDIASLTSGNGIKHPRASVSMEDM